MCIRDRVKLARKVTVTKFEFWKKSNNVIIVYWLQPWRYIVCTGAQPKREGRKLLFFFDKLNFSYGRIGALFVESSSRGLVEGCSEYMFMLLTAGSLWVIGFELWLSDYVVQPSYYFVIGIVFGLWEYRRYRTFGRRQYFTPAVRDCRYRTEGRRHILPVLRDCSVREDL